VSDPFSPTEKRVSFDKVHTQFGSSLIDRDRWQITGLSADPRRQPVEII
jgi:hypothetical protein